MSLAGAGDCIEECALVFRQLPDEFGRAESAELTEDGHLSAKSQPGKDTRRGGCWQEAQKHGLVPCIEIRESLGRKVRRGFEQEVLKSSGLLRRSEETNFTGQFAGREFF